jgi:hypothetical protein
MLIDELNDELKQKFSDIESDVKSIVIRFAEFTKDVKIFTKNKQDEQTSKKLGVNIGDIVNWRGVKAKIEDFEDGLPKVSIFVAENKTSGILHKVMNVKEISKW